jgi:dolichol kinase
MFTGPGVGPVTRMSHGRYEAAPNRERRGGCGGAGVPRGRRDAIFPGMTTQADSELAQLVARTAGPQPWRRVFHAVNGLVLAGVLLVLDPPWMVIVPLLVALTAGAFLVDVLRFSAPGANRLFFRVFGPLASPREARGVASSTWYLVGCTLAVATFPREIAVGAILVLALADPAASWLGRRHGKRRLGTGTVLGSAVFTGVAVLVLVPFVGPVSALLVALGTAAAEVLPWPLDDNLVVPLVAGALAWSLVPLV